MGQMGVSKKERQQESRTESQAKIMKNNANRKKRTHTIYTRYTNTIVGVKCSTAHCSRTANLFKVLAAKN